MAGNRTKAPTLITKAPWASWKGTEAGLYIKFIERYCRNPHANPVRLTMNGYQRDLIELWLQPDVTAAATKMPRGNAKSTTLACFALAHLFLMEGASIPIVASTVTQAHNTIYGPICRMVELEPELHERTNRYTAIGASRLTVPATNGVAYPLADRPSGLQGLNPSLAILDEASEATMDTWNALLLAGGKRDWSKLLAISTPSLNNDNALLTLERAYKSGLSMPGFAFTEYTAPDGCAIDDRDAWFAANPALSTNPPVLRIAALERDLAGSTPSAFRCYRLAQWVEDAEGNWLGEHASAVWDANAEPYDFTEGAETYVGVDYAYSYDTCAVVVGQYQPSGKLHAKAQIWQPSGNGGLQIAELGNYLRQLHAKYLLIDVAYDPHGIETLAYNLENEGLPMLEYRQNATNMIPAVMECRDAIHNAEITHDGDSAFRYQVLNARPHYYDSGFTLKKRDNQKIDAAVALCLMHRAATLNKPRDWTIYSL